MLLLDLRRASPVADFFVICSGKSTLHVRAIADEITQRMKELRNPASHVEGYDVAQWVLIDFIDVLVHIFLPDVRQYFGLDRLWGDVPTRRFSDTGVD